MYSGGGWLPLDPPIEWGAEVTGIDGDVWTVDIDFNQDGIPDATWTLYRQ